MTQCNICGEEFQPKEGYEWAKNCYPCFKAGKVPKSAKSQADEKVLEALRLLYEQGESTQKLLQTINAKLNGEVEER